MSDPYPAISPITPPTEVLSGEPENQMEILALQLARGEPEAFWEFFESYGPRLVNLFKRKGVPDTDAEKLALECLQHVCRQIDKYQPKDNSTFASWIFTIATRKRIDWWRRNAPTVLLNSGTLDDLNERDSKVFSSAISVSLDEKSLVELKGGRVLQFDFTDCREVEPESAEENAQAVNDALEQLSDADREVINLRFFDANLDNAALAAHLGIQVNAAKTRLSRAIQRLRKLLENDPRIKIRK